MKKQTFGLIITTRSFFPSHLVKTAKEEITKKLTDLGYDYVMVSEKDTDLGAVLSYDEAVTCAKLFKANAEDISGIIVILPNFGEETGVADAIELASLDVPILVQACDDDFDKMGLDNRRDAFCGKLSLCNNLYQRGIKFSTTKTHTCKITSDAFTDDLLNFAAVCRITSGVKNMRIAAIGARPSAFHTVRFSEKILQKHKIGVHTVDMSEIIFTAMNMPTDDTVTVKVAEIKAYGNIPADISDEKILKQAKLCIAMENFVDDNHCQASAVQCWDSVQNNYGCATCLGMSMMGEKGKPSACEMDITGALTMYAFRQAANSAPAYMDWNNNVKDDRDMCICLHCSNFPKSFFGKENIEISNLDVLATTLDVDKCFGACKGQVAAGPMTFAKISTDDTRGVLKLYVGEGEFLADKVDTKGGVANCRVGGLQDLLHYMCDNGYEHHVSFVRGHVADAMAEAFGKYIGAEVYRHKA